MATDILSEDNQEINDNSKSSVFLWIFFFFLCFMWHFKEETNCCFGSTIRLLDEREKRLQNAWILGNISVKKIRLKLKKFPFSLFLPQPKEKSVELQGNSHLLELWTNHQLIASRDDCRMKEHCDEKVFKKHKRNVKEKKINIKNTFLLSLCFTFADFSNHYNFLG